MILGTTGTTSGPRPAQHDAFKRFVRRCPPDGFVHGGARGWDTLAHLALTSAWPGIPVDIYPSNHPTEGSGSAWNYVGWTGNVTVHPEAPPLERDRVIVERIHWLIAIPRTDEEELRSGTWATVRYARENGLPIYIIRSDGRFMKDNDL